MQKASDSLVCPVEIKRNAYSVACIFDTDFSYRVYQDLVKLNLILGQIKFSLLPRLPQKILLDSKVVK